MRIGRDVQTKGASIYFIPITTRVPLKYGAETVTSVTVCRVRLTVETQEGRRATGWGESPLAVQWVWPGDLPYDYRHTLLKQLALDIGEAFAEFPASGHPIEISDDFQTGELPSIVSKINERHSPHERLPWLAALVAFSPFDIALHDAYGMLHEVPVYATYDGAYMNRDLAAYLEPAHAPVDGRSRGVSVGGGARAGRSLNASVDGKGFTFAGKYPKDYLVHTRPDRLRAWHLVGGLDPLDASELSGTEPSDGYPILLGDWIRQDGLTCLKVKLRGSDLEWDYDRIVRVGRLAWPLGVQWLSTDFNCTVRDPEYVIEILDRLAADEARVYGMVLYVEQPFPYELMDHQIDVHAVSARKPLFMDESAHDWSLVRVGRELGWTGVALKTCKTQSGALLSLAWAKAHGMTLMVQDLTNPMLAQIPHTLLAAHAGTIMGVETNAMQYYPAASEAEAQVHPGLYTRKAGMIDLSTVGGPGFGYRIEQIKRQLPEEAGKKA